MPVTHPSTNPARRTATSLIRHSTLSLHHANTLRGQAKYSRLTNYTVTGVSRSWKGGNLASTDAQVYNGSLWSEMEAWSWKHLGFHVQN